MRITLTYAEGRTVRSRVPDEVMRDMLLEVRRHTFRKSHVYDLPPVGWRRVLDGLRSVAYGDRGGRADHADSLYTAIAKIADAVALRELHPAYKGRAVVGMSSEVVVGFSNGDRTGPYPPGEYTVLCPHHLTKYGKRLTVWRPSGWCQSAVEPCERMEFQLLFWVPAQSGGQ